MPAWQPASSTRGPTLYLLLLANPTSRVVRGSRLGKNPKEEVHNNIKHRSLQDDDETIIVPDWGTPSRFDNAEGGFAGIDFGYLSAGFDFGDDGVTGISYYLRAFDMFPKHYTNQLGWGQWLNPDYPQDEGSSCPLNPHTVICYPSDADGPNPEDYDEVRDCTWPEGSPNLDLCMDGICGWDERNVLGAFEGGMGYWPYTSGHKGVKWLTPSSISGSYGDKYGGAFINGYTQQCTNLGGAIQIANNLIVPPDFFSFEKDDEGWTDGMLGYMLQRTPIGKLHEDDNRNYWTIIVDTDNFAGPVVYTSAYFWEHPHNWRPDIKTWADPEVKIGSFTEGTEGGLGTTAVQQGDWYYFRTQDVVFPLDIDDSSVTSFTNHASYPTDWIIDALEPVLDGSVSDTTPATIRAANAAARVKPGCYTRDEIEPERLEWVVSMVDDDGKLLEEHPTGGLYLKGWGIGDIRIPDNRDEADSNWCRTKIPIDQTSPYLTCDGKKCKLTPYFRLPVDGSSQIGELISESEMETEHPNVKKAVDDRADEVWPEPSRVNDGSTLGPATDDEKVCFDTPGPSDAKVYCRRTRDERWVAYQWYRFVDQPELNQVFASLPDDEGMQAKCYMQQRIERLHELQAKEDIPSWFGPPGDHPQNKAKLDEGFLVVPPFGMEKGYVPVSIYSRVREMPTNCDVVEGNYDTEPNPLPDDYYDVPEKLDLVTYPDKCFPTSVSDGEYDRVGTLHLTKRDGSGDKYTHRVPFKSEVATSLVDRYDPEVCTSSDNPGLTPAPTSEPVPTRAPNPPNGEAPTPSNPTCSARESFSVTSLLKRASKWWGE